MLLSLRVDTDVEIGTLAIITHPDQATVVGLAIRLYQAFGRIVVGIMTNTRAGIVLKILLRTPRSVQKLECRTLATNSTRQSSNWLINKLATLEPPRGDRFTGYHSTLHLGHAASR